jgi:hypothetical protein
MAKILRNRNPDPDLLAAYEGIVPRNARFASSYDDGYWFIKITAIDGKKLGDDTLLVSQAKRQSDILHQVNDLIMTYRDIPEDLRSFYENQITLEGNIRGEKA